MSRHNSKRGDRCVHSFPRQQGDDSVRSMLDRKYGLLAENQKTLLARLCVFTGGWRPEAAETVCSDGTVERCEVPNLLAALVNDEFVICEEGRYLISDTVLDFAREKLKASGE